MKTKMKIMTVTGMMIGLGLLSSLAQAAPTPAPEQEFNGSSNVALGYVGTNGAKVAACMTLFWALGSPCVDDSADWGTLGSWTIWKSGDVSVDSKIIVKTWGEGKVLVIYSLNSTNGCAGVQKTYVGYQTAYETYNLYALSANQTDVNPAEAHPNAELSIESDTAHLGLLQPITATTTQDRGNECSWGIGTDVALSFDRK